MDEYVRPDPSQAALLTIDVQNDFTRPDASAAVPGTTDAVPQMQRLVDAFRDAARPIVHVVRLYKADGSNVDQCRRTEVEAGAEIVRPRTPGAELVAALKPTADVRLDADQLLDGQLQAIGEHEWVMYKPRWGAFYQTPLGDQLATLDVNTVVVCGCNFPNCPRTTIYEASERDYRIVFVADATSQTYERGLNELAAIGVTVKDTAATTEWLTGGVE